jgi:hypothetical protein
LDEECIKSYISIRDLIEKKQQRSLKTVTIGHWHKNAKCKSNRYKTAKIKIERQRKGIDETS